MRIARLSKAAIAFSLMLMAATATLTAQAAGPPLIVLLTDFRQRDFYVGALKGSIYNVYPDARIDSITHEVPEFDVRAGARTLAQASTEFPKGTIFVAIVDPGVGTTRKPIAILTKSRRIYIGPDNGIFTEVMRLENVKEVREITNRKLMREGEISTTFQGRDIFGPAAAHLARGVRFRELGPILPTWVQLPEIPAAGIAGGKISGVIQDIDAYGNLITNIGSDLVSQAKLALGQKVVVSVGQTEFEATFVKTYADVAEGERLVLVNSQGVIEAAANMANLARMLRSRRGDQVTVRPCEEKKP